MNEAEYHAARGELQRLEAMPDRSQPQQERLDTLRKEVKVFEEGVRSKGKPGQE
ncbi:hypothetical protein [Caenispirillum salinarum]|uniref:hypothetical protein n=1 Tax=Caenispirillum salinarum TaxID=859058 RepID=UPI00384BDB47